jgi:MoaA/NifB/PqqE/SkfB family radical SAM enzyme
MKCKHCFYNEEFKKKNEIASRQLAFEELEKIADSINKILYLSITGGEPFIRDDIADIVKLFTGKNKVRRYQMPTSGFKTSMILEKTIKILDNNPDIPFRVHVSIDGNKKIHEKIRGQSNSFGNALDTIKELNKLKKIYSFFDVSVVTTINSLNQYIVEEIGNIVESVNEGGEWCINIIRGVPLESEMMEVDIKNYIKAHEIIEKRIKEGSYKGYSGHLTAKWLSAKNAVRRKIIYKILNNKHKGGGCSAGSLGGVVFPDGSVFPCELLEKSFGNLRDYDYNLPVLWNSRGADDIRNYIQESRCMCTQECNLSSNFLIQPQTWPLVIRERLKY